VPELDRILAIGLCFKRVQTDRGFPCVRYAAGYPIDRGVIGAAGVKRYKEGSDRFVLSLGMIMGFGLLAVVMAAQYRRNYGGDLLELAAPEREPAVLLSEVQAC
jgi:hypothetical protein